MYKRLLAIVALSVVLSGEQLTASGLSYKINKKARIGINPITGSRHLDDCCNAAQKESSRLFIPRSVGRDKSFNNKQWSTELNHNTQDAKNQKRRAWIRSVLDGKVSWNERFQDDGHFSCTPLELAIMVADSELITAVLARNEGKSLVQRCGRLAPLDMSFMFGNKRIRKLLLNEPTINVNQSTGSFPAVIQTLYCGSKSTVRQFLGDARLTLLERDKNTEQGTSVNELILSIIGPVFSWPDIKKHLLALVSRKDFPGGVTRDFFNALQKHAGREKDFDERGFADIVPTHESLLLAKEEFLACKRQKLKKKKTKIQKVLDAHQSSQPVDEVVNTIFDVMRSGNSATCALLEQAPFKQCFGILRNISAYDVEDSSPVMLQHQNGHCSSNTVPSFTM